MGKDFFSKEHDDLWEEAAQRAIRWLDPGASFFIECIGGWGSIDMTTREGVSQFLSVLSATTPIDTAFRSDVPLPLDQWLALFAATSLHHHCCWQAHFTNDDDRYRPWVEVARGTGREAADNWADDQDINSLTGDQIHRFFTATDASEIWVDWTLPDVGHLVRNLI